MVIMVTLVNMVTIMTHYDHGHHSHTGHHGHHGQGTMIIGQVTMVSLIIGGQAAGLPASGAETEDCYQFCDSRTLTTCTRNC